MKLRLFDEDLKPEHRGVDAKEVVFDMFLPEVQEAILFMKGASFGQRMVLCSSEDQQRYDRVRDARRQQQSDKHSGRGRPSGVPFGH